MKLTKLYGKYFQKSRNFLYPMLGFAKSANISPINTYIAWEDQISASEMKIIVLYKLEETEGFRNFEKQVLFKNRYFVDFKECDDGVHIAYIFTFESHKEDWTRFLRGKYSQFSPDIKNRIKTHHGENSAEWKYLDSFLYPNKYLENYTELLAGPLDFNEMLDILERVGELCDPYDKEKEKLKIGIKHFELLQ